MLDHYGASVYAEYCLGDPRPLATVVDGVVAGFERVDFNPAQSNERDLVYQILRGNYPCATVTPAS